MTSANISSPEFTSPFQIAAHLEIPGLPRITHPALAANQAPQVRSSMAKDKKQQSAKINATIQSAHGHLMKKLNEFDLWLAALSM